MDTLTIKIRDSKTLKLIYDLEELNLIEVVNAVETRPEKKLSDLLSGSISKEQAEKLQIELTQMRSQHPTNL